MGAHLIIRTMTGLSLSASAAAQSTAAGTAAEAEAMLQRAVAELKQDQTAALARFNNPTAGFRKVSSTCSASI
jgi:hypothetical protein